MKFRVVDSRRISRKQFVCVVLILKISFRFIILRIPYEFITPINGVPFYSTVFTLKV